MKKKISFLILLIMISNLFFGCKGQTVAQSKEGEYGGRAFYEIFVRAFNDSNGDGIGDIKGVTQKLDYLKELGIEGIWLMPINDSPSYHGYDVTDYYSINPQYGTMEDFKELLKEAHKRGIMIMMDLVINHTSTENKWFKEARQDKNSKYRDWYVWTEDKNKASETSAMGTAPWIKNGDKEEYYYAIFWEGMPDLNFDNGEVKEEVKNIAKFYMDMGVDGFRLDAAKWIYEASDKNVAWWNEFNDYVKSVNKKAILLGEVWDNTYAMAPYSKALDSMFCFSLGENIIKGVNSESIKDIASQIEDDYDTLKGENKDFVPATFLTNHDQNRVMSVLNDDEKMKQAAAIYLTLPGNPFIYYGEELGMTGVKPDEAIREPFIWDNKDLSKNTSWESSTNELDKVAFNIQKNDKESIYNFYKSILSVRSSSKALKYGELVPLDSEESSVLIFKRTKDKENATVIINSSKEDKNIKLEQGKYKVLYSNIRKDKKVVSKGTITLKSGEIIILNN